MHYYIIKGISRPRSLYADGIYLLHGPFSSASHSLSRSGSLSSGSARWLACAPPPPLSLIVVAVVVVRPPVSPLRVALFLARALGALIKRAGGVGGSGAEEPAREKERDGFRRLA